MANEKDTAFKNIDYVNKSIAQPLPDKITDIDTTGQFYDTIISSVESSSTDLNAINNFTNISRSRDTVYDLIDMMGEDPVIGSALEIYTSDVCEPNDKGRIIWCESDDNKVLGAVTMLLDSMNIEKNSHDWVYNLIKYGDVYLRLFRKSEIEGKPSFKNTEESNVLNEGLEDDNKLINEDVILKLFSKDDRYAEYLEMVKNPAEVFDLQKFGKSFGYLRTHINKTKVNPADSLNVYDTNQFSFKFKKSDVDVYSATEFVHACVGDSTDRVEEEVTIGTNMNEEDSDDTNSLTFKVKRGKSILYDSFKIWRELSLLENAVLLNRLTKSSIVRTVAVEIGDMDKDNARNLMTRIKQMIEQKSAINVGKSLNEYTNPGPMENVIITPTHDGKGAITTGQIGGDVEVGDLNDLNWWKKKLFASLGIPGQYLGDTDDATGFNGGTSLSLISSRYAKTIKKIQNAYIQLITDAINLMLLDRGLTSYINKFTLKMQSPATQEERDRRDNMSNYISTIQNIMSLLDIIDDKQTKLEILKSLLSTVVSDENIMTLIQNEIDKLEEEVENENNDGNEENDLFSEGPDSLPLPDLGGGDTLPDFSTETEIGGEEEAEPIEEPAEAEAPIEGEEPVESFYSRKGGTALNEKDNLPSWEDLGLSYDQMS